MRSGNLRRSSRPRCHSDFTWRRSSRVCGFCLAHYVTRKAAGLSAAALFGQVLTTGSRTTRLLRLCSAEHCRAEGVWGRSPDHICSEGILWGDRGLPYPIAGEVDVTLAAAATERLPWLLAGAGALLQRSQIGQRMLHGLPAHLFVGTQTAADFRPLRLAIDETAVIRAKLNAPHPRRLAFRHPGNGRRQGRRDTASPAANAALHARAVHPTGDRNALPVDSARAGTTDWAEHPG